MKITGAGLEHNCYRESVFLNRMRFGSFIVIFWMAADRRLLGFPVPLCYFLLLHSAANVTGYGRNCPGTFSCGNLGSVGFPFTKITGSECDLLPISGCDTPDADKHLHLGNQTYKIENISQGDHAILQGDSASIFVHETGATINLWEFRETMSLHVVNRVAFFGCIHHFNNDKLPEGISLYTRCPKKDHGIYFSFDHDFPADRVKDTFPSLSTACSVNLDPSSILHNSLIPCTFLSSFVQLEVTLSKSCEEDNCDGSFAPAANYGNPGAPPPSSTDHKGQAWNAPKIGYPTKCFEPFDCGKLRSVGFPFANSTSSVCGLPISGCDDPDAEVHLGSQTYKIESINREYNNSIFVLETGAPINLWEFRETMSLHVVNRVAFFRCIHDFNGGKLPEDIFQYTLCPQKDYGIYFSFDHDFPVDRVKDTFPSLPTACSVHPDHSVLHNSLIPCTCLSSFVEIEVTLSKSCEKDNCDGSFVAAAPPPSSTDDNGHDLKAPIIGLSVGLAAMTVIALCLFCAILSPYKRRHSSSDYQNKARNIYSSSNSNTRLESRTVYFGIPVFPYEELQEATDNFDQARVLGEGGFGTVYYGKLRDGREVAVKRLYERNYRPVESFINEIQILTRLRHKNLVSLYGCTSRHSRELLLVYEYVPNGTVSYHLHGDKSKSALLPWHVRMKIAIETANALAYLHASDIIHRDVKTSNILLDNNFSVKVADFGLSRLFPDDVTHISTAPRGTPGYVDPDYRLCYQLTSKSDVYSFGVVLVELISSLPAVDMNRDRDEIKLANLAQRKIQKGAFCEVVDPNLGFQSDDKSRRMMISVAKLAFQCLQGDKNMRPSMCEVLEVLQRIESGKDEPGNLEGIEVHSAGVSPGNSHPLPPNTVIKPKRLHQTL